MQHHATTYNKVAKRYKLFLHNKCCALLYEKLGSFDRGLSLTLQGKPEHTEMAYVLSWTSGRKLQRKNFSLTRRKIDKE